MKAEPIRSGSDKQLPEDFLSSLILFGVTIKDKVFPPRVLPIPSMCALKLWFYTACVWVLAVLQCLCVDAFFQRLISICSFISLSLLSCLQFSHLFWIPCIIMSECVFFAFSITFLLNNIRIILLFNNVEPEFRFCDNIVDFKSNQSLFCVTGLPPVLPSGLIRDLNNIVIDAPWKWLWQITIFSQLAMYAHTECSKDSSKQWRRCFLSCNISKHQNRLLWLWYCRLTTVNHNNKRNIAVHQLHYIEFLTFVICSELFYRASVS